jgi:hypothetical protein
MYATITHFHFKHGTYRQAMDLVQEHIVKPMEEAHEVRYWFTLKSGPDQATSVVVYHNEQEAEHARARLLELLHGKIGHLLDRSEVEAHGEVVVHAVD